MDIEIGMPRVTARKKLPIRTSMGTPKPSSKIDLTGEIPGTA